MEKHIDLYNVTSPAPTKSSPLGSCTQAAFSSYKELTATKLTSAGTATNLTSAGTAYPFKGKTIATYASSLSATQGSASEAEAENNATRDNTLVGVGYWMVESAPLLKGSARACKRQRVNLRLKHNKPPVVIIQQRGISCALSDDECSTVAKPEDRFNRKGMHMRTCALMTRM